MVSGSLAKLDSGMARTYGKMAMYEGQLQKQVNSTSNSIEKQSSIWGKFTGLVGGYFALSGLQQLGSSIFSIGTNIEQTNIAFTTLLGSQDLANQKIAEMKKFADFSPFNTREVLSAGKSLLGFGLEADKLMPIMSKLGDASMGNAASFQSLVDNYGKMVGAQRANTVDLNQFAIAGVPIWREVGKIVDKQGQELRKYVEQNGVGLNIIDQAFENLTKSGGQFFGMMQAQSVSTGGKWSTFMSKLEDSATRAFNKLQPYINSLIDLGMTWLPLAEGAMRTLWNTGEAFGGWLAAHEGSLMVVAGALGGLATAYAYTSTVSFLYGGVLKGLTLIEGIQYGWMLLQEWATYRLAAANAFLTKTMLNSPWGWIAIGIGAVVGGLVYAYKNFESFRLMVWGVGQSIFDFFGGLGKMIAGLFDPKLMREGANQFMSSLNGQSYNKGKSDRKTKEQAEKEQKAAAEKKSTTSVVTPSGIAPGVAPSKTTSAGAAGGSGGAGGGGSARNVSVSIQQLIGKLEISTTNIAGAGESEIREAVKRILVGAVRDSELSLSNG